jgi:hypothetical protein
LNGGRTSLVQKNMDKNIIPMNAEPPKRVDFVSLYNLAFEQFGVAALWSSRPVPNPTPADALAITRALRTHGGMDGRRLAEQIESLCRAPH